MKFGQGPLLRKKKKNSFKTSGKKPKTSDFETTRKLTLRAFRIKKNPFN